jgi:hypothetical protein
VQLVGIQIYKRLRDLLPLPNTYNVKNSQEIAEETVNICINELIKLITFDIKDLYVNLPTQGCYRRQNSGYKKSLNNEEMN